MESLFQEVGSCGCFQISHVLCVQSVRLAASWALHLMVFGGYAPPWRCVRYPRTANETQPLLNNTSLITQNSPAYIYGDLKRMQLDENSDKSLSAIQGQYGSFNLKDDDIVNGTSAISFPGTCSQLPLCDEVVFDETSVTVVSDFGLICDQAFTPSFIVALQMLGMLFGCVASGQFGELCGRKISIYTFLGLMSASTLIAAWSTSWHMHAALTFFIGFGGSGVISTHFVYAMEFLNPKWRGYFAAIPVGSLCLIIFACVIFGLKNWRHLYLLSGSLGAVTLLTAFWAPESLRWLHTHGKANESKEVIKKIMALNKRQVDLSDVLKNLHEEDKKQTDVSRKYTLLDLFRSKSLCAISVKASIVWCSLQLCYTTMSYGIKALSGNFYANLFILVVSEIPFMIPMSRLLNKVGRKYTLTFYLTLTVVCFIASIITFYVADPQTSSSIIKYLAIISKGSADVGLTALAIFVVELYPTAVRNLAIGLFNTVARIGTIGAALLIPRDQASTMICIFILVGSSLFGAGLVLSLPETKDKPLVDTLKDRDSNIADDKSCDSESEV